jgi:AP-3 complex subunit delta-1
MDIVRKLMIHMDKAEGSHYRDELLSKIIEICSQNDYQHITNFEWLTLSFITKKYILYLYRYISILVELTRLEGTKHGSLISLQVLDVAVRVESIRQFACNQMVNVILFFSLKINESFQAILLENAHVFILGSNSTSVAEVLYAAAWVCGEFSS